MGSRSSCALVEPKASIIHRIVKERLLFSTGSSVKSSCYPFVRALTITILRGSILLRVGCKDPSDQDTLAGRELHPLKIIAFHGAHKDSVVQGIIGSLIS